MHEPLVALAALALVFAALAPPERPARWFPGMQGSGSWSPANALFGIFVVAFLSNFLPRSLVPIIGQLLLLALVLVGLKTMVRGLFR